MTRRMADCGILAIVDDLGDVLLIKRPKFDSISSKLIDAWTFYRKDGKNLISIISP